MRPIEKTASDLFQKLRTRYSPITLGNEKAESTSDPESARFFNFVFKENEEERGPVSISLVDGRSMKVFFGEGMTDRMQDKAEWYNFLRELRAFAKRNLLLFDARDIAKSQLDTRDFGWLSKVDGKMDEKNITVSESTMWGSKRRSYQALESVKMIVQHNKSVDESVPGARSRSIQAIYLERSDGERYKFPYNYLTGARAMARHISEGGTPYDPIGQHVLSMIKEMRDLSKFARMSKKVANEDESAAEIRQRVVERFHGLKGTLGALSHVSGYNEFKENFKPQVNEEENQNLEDLRERFTRKIWDNKMEELLPAVVRALESAEVMEAPASVEKMIKDPNRLIVLKKDPAGDAMVRNTKFTDAHGLMGFILSDIATRAIGDDMDPLANFAASVVDRLGERDLDAKDHQLGMMLAKRYIDDIKRMATDEEYANLIRKDPTDVYGKKRKLSGGFHEAEEYESWAEDIMPEIAREGSGDKPEHRDDNNQDDKRWDDAEDAEDAEEVEEAVPQAPIKPGEQQQQQIDPKALNQAAKNVSRVAQASGLTTQPAMVAKTMSAMAKGQPLGKQGTAVLGGLGNAIMQAAAGDPVKAAKLTTTMRNIMRNEGVDAMLETLEQIVRETSELADIKKLSGV